MGSNEESMSEIREKALAIDVFSGITAATCLAPFITIVDQAVTEYAAQKAPSVFTAAATNTRMLFFSPLRFIARPIFFIVCGVYGGTYVTANAIDTMCRFKSKDSTYYKLFGTTAVNMTLGVMKDRWIAINYNGKPPASFPAASWALFLFRDTLTVGAGFIIPPPVAKMLLEKQYVKSPERATAVAQIGVPIVAQLILTPIHLLALDFYNNQIATLSQRIATVRAKNVESTIIRWGRVFAAYGIAGLVNSGLRTNLRAKYLPEQYHLKKI